MNKYSWFSNFVRLKIQIKCVNVFSLVLSCWYNRARVSSAQLGYPAPKADVVFFYVFSLSLSLSLSLSFSLSFLPFSLLILFDIVYNTTSFEMIRS